MAEVEPPVETVVAEPTAQIAQPEQTSTAEPVAETTPEAERTFSQKDVDEIVQKRLSKESRRLSRDAERQAHLQAEALYYKRLAEDKSPPPSKSPDGKPVAADFSDYEAFTEALTGWTVKQAVQAMQQESAQQQQQRRSQEYAAQASEKLAAGQQKYDDFDDVVSNPSLPVTAHMAEAIVETEAPDEVSYYLGSNPHEAARIASLSPIRQVWEIDKIAQKFVKQATPTKAPPPIKPSTATSSGSKDIWSKETPWNEFVKARRKAVAGQ